MERKVSPSLNQQKPNTKSSFISQNTPQSKEKVSLQLHSRKQLSSSTFLDLEDSKQKAPPSPNPDRKISKEAFSPLTQEGQGLFIQLNRARSLKHIEEGKFKSMKLIESSQMDSFNSLNENTLKLKSQELLFKLKVRLSTLLQEISIPQAEIVRFNKLAKVDEIVLFLSEKVKDRVAQLTAQHTETSVSISEKSHPQLEALRSKLAEKQANEKTYRSKLKDSYAQLKALYQKVNTKEKEYSQKITQVYQLKTQLKETEKLVEAQKHKLIAFQKEKTEMKNLINNDSKDQHELIAGFQQEKDELQLQLEETRQELEKYKQKDSKLQELNVQLSEELTRWRQRFQFQVQRRQPSEKEKSSQGNPLTPNDLMVGSNPNELKKSTMSMSNAYINNFNNTTKVSSLTSLQIQNAKLKLQVKELQKQNQQLQRNLLNYSTFKEKYQDMLGLVGERQVDLNNGIDNKKLDYLKDRSAELFRKEIENHYKRKTEQVAREWKEKLYQIVCKYQDQIEVLKAQISDLSRGQEQSEKKIYTLANEKYELQTSLLSLQKQINSRTRIPSIKQLIIPSSSPDNLTSEKQEESDLNISGSHSQLRPIAEEDSPLKSKKQSSTEEPTLLNELGRPV